MRFKNLKKAGYLMLLGVSVAAGTVVAKIPKPPPKLPGDIIYYSDSSMIYEVGREIVSCNGMSYFVFGYETPYKTQEFFYCPPPIPE